MSLYPDISPPECTSRRATDELSPAPGGGIDSHGEQLAPLTHPRIRLINADCSQVRGKGDLLPEAACSCDSNNPICVIGDVPVSGKLCGIYG